MKIRIDGLEEALAKFSQLQGIDFGESAKRAATDIYNMGQTRTPKKSGELRVSMGVNRMSKTAYQVGYAKEYAPHVEYGHRIVRNGSQIGYVEGQRFLHSMTEDERDVFRDYIREQIAKGR